MTSKEYYALQYPTGELVALDHASGNYPYRADNIHEAWLVEKSQLDESAPVRLEKYRMACPGNDFKLVIVSINVRPAE